MKENESYKDFKSATFGVERDPRNIKYFIIEEINCDDGLKYVYSSGCKWNDPAADLVAYALVRFFEEKTPVSEAMHYLSHLGCVMSDKEFILNMLRRDIVDYLDYGIIYHFLSEDLKKDSEFILRYVKLSYGFFSFVDASYINEDVVLAAIDAACGVYDCIEDIIDVDSLCADSQQAEIEVEAGTFNYFRHLYPQFKTILLKLSYDKDFLRKAAKDSCGCVFKMIYYFAKTLHGADERFLREIFLINAMSHSDVVIDSDYAISSINLPEIFKLKMFTDFDDISFLIEEAISDDYRNIFFVIDLMFSSRYDDTDEYHHYELYKNFNSVKCELDALDKWIIMALSQKESIIGGLLMYHSRYQKTCSSDSEEEENTKDQANCKLRNEILLEAREISLKAKLERFVRHFPLMLLKNGGDEIKLMTKLMSSCLYDVQMIFECFNSQGLKEEKKYLSEECEGCEECEELKKIILDQSFEVEDKNSFLQRCLESLNLSANISNDLYDINFEYIYNEFISEKNTIIDPISFNRGIFFLTYPLSVAHLSSDDKLKIKTGLIFIYNIIFVDEDEGAVLLWRYSPLKSTLENALKALDPDKKVVSDSRSFFSVEVEKDSLIKCISEVSSWLMRNTPAMLEASAEFSKARAGKVSGALFTPASAGDSYFAVDGSEGGAKRLKLDAGS